MDDNISKGNEKNRKLLFLKKVKIGNNQIMKNELKQFFWNVDNYFQKNYDKYDILIGNNNNKKNVIIPSMLLKSMKKKIKKGNMNQKMANSSHSQDKKNSESKITFNSNTSRFDRKRGPLKNSKEVLKVGQKYITESELEDLFNAFSIVQKINKKKSKNFIMAKDYIDKHILIANKTFSNFGKFNENKKNQLNIPNKILPDLPISSNYKESTYYNMPMNEKIFKKEIFTKKNEDFDEEKKYKTVTNFFRRNKIFENKKIKKRNKLIRKQNQYLSSKNEKKNEGLELNKAINDYYANLLADQEQVILNTEKNKIKKNKITKSLSKTTKKKENKLLLKDIESYRVANELKDKFCNLGAKLEPEHNYCWKRDLRGDLYITKKNEDNPNYFNIRNPFNKLINGSFSDKNLTKKKYLKYYKSLLDENNNINKNLQGLYIIGKNLLRMEYEQFKSIKNRKILNNYETYLPSSEVEDIIFIDKKYSNK